MDSVPRDLKRLAFSYRLESTFACLNQEVFCLVGALLPWGPEGGQRRYTG